MYRSAARALAESAITAFREDTLRFAHPLPAVLSVTVHWPRPAEHLLERREPFHLPSTMRFGVAQRAQSGTRKVIDVAPQFADEAPPLEAHQDAEMIIDAMRRALPPRVARLESIRTQVLWVVGQADVDVRLLVAS